MRTNRNPNPFTVAFAVATALGTSMSLGFLAFVSALSWWLVNGWTDFVYWFGLWFAVSAVLFSAASGPAGLTKDDESA